MLSVAEAVQTIVKRSPYLTDALADDIVNLSSLARRLHREIENETKKTVKTGAIIVALRRLAFALNKKRKKMTTPLDFGDMTVRSNLMELTYATSDTFVSTEKRLVQKYLGSAEGFFNVSQGVRQTTVIVSQSIAGNVKNAFRNERLLSSFDELASISINLPQEVVRTPGAYYSILKVLAWEGINLIEVLSTYTELTLLFRGEDIDRAFTRLKRYFT